jgi:hypothetical protein
MESNYDKYVMGQTMGKFGVISVHVWIEHLLALCVRRVVADPEPLFRERALAFPHLVSLCEAHGVIDRSLAQLLHQVSSLRNKCAHQLTFQPGDDEMSLLTPDINRIALPPDADAYPLRRIADLLERRAIAIGAIEPMRHSAGAGPA